MTVTWYSITWRILWMPLSDDEAPVGRKATMPARAASTTSGTISSLFTVAVIVAPQSLNGD